MRDFKNVVRIASVYTGAVVGAGFASGQEIMQFFLMYQHKSIYGIILSGILFSVVGVVVLSKIHSANISCFDQYMIPVVGRGLNSILKGAVNLYMLSGFCIMLAGSGALLHEQFAWNKNVGIVLMALLCGIVFVRGIEGVVVINTLLTPIMIIGIIFIGIRVVVLQETDIMAVMNVVSAVTDNWLFSALLYVGYNVLTIIIIMTALRTVITTKTVAVMGGLCGGLCLVMVAVVMWAVMRIFYNEIVFYEIPFLHVAGKSDMHYPYIFILISAMFTTAISNGYGFLASFKPFQKNCCHNKKMCYVSIFLLVGILMAQMGFSRLIRGLYSSFGYIGIFILFVILLDSRKTILPYCKNKTNMLK